jgi:tryptophan synthase beta chain
MEYREYFGSFGGRYVAEVLQAPLQELETACREHLERNDFWQEFDAAAKDYIGRPTPLLYASNATREIGGAKIYIKLEGLANTGAHKINNALGQVLLAKRMGKKRIIAETGAGQHGVAAAAVCAKFGIPCTVYMGSVDIRRQRPNVFWMEMYGAEVVPVESGSGTLKDSINEALRDWAANYTDTHYLIGSALGPSPYPHMVREFQSVVGRETAAQAAERGIRPAALIACVGGGSNAIGFFAPYLEEDPGETGAPRLVGVEAGGTGRGPGKHAARMSGEGRDGIVHGYKSLFLLDEDGQVGLTHSISAGLDYPGIGPQLAELGHTGRVDFTKAADAEALEAVRFFARTEGLIFALESAHAAAAGIKIAREFDKDKTIIINMSGRGDKDLFICARALDPDAWAGFLREEAARCEGSIGAV